VELFRKHFSEGSHIVNQLGTSESYNYRLYPVDHRIPIENANIAGGYSVSPEREVLILDEDRRELPVGAMGEIGIKSDYMSAGYWRDEPLTQKKFIHIGADPTPVYLTGDLGKLEPDGCLLHLGRKDFQVKIRGYRVELAEVDHALSAAPGVVDSAAWVVKNRLGQDQLVGYVVPKKKGQFDQQAVERYLQSRLPDYMTPSHYVVLDSLPTLPTGKVDRNALPNPFVEMESTAGAAAEPALVAFTSTEQRILHLFREVLQQDNVDMQTNFFRVGGDSLLTAFLLTRIYQAFGVEVPIGEFAASPTPAKVVELVAAAAACPNNQDWEARNAA
jgi:acyl-coenzyme A synthetase/AMP-(fatty) acid ligase/acyl carrier protein